MTELTIKVVASYLLGSVIGSLWVGRLYGGVDIRKLGSGNAGATNALRARGKTFAFLVLLIDIAKGWLATRVVARLSIAGVAPSSAALEHWAASACAIAVIVGHVYPLWHGFRGGKGVATLVGVVVGLDPTLLFPVLVTWVLSVMLFGYVGLASMIATLSVPVAAAVGFGMANSPGPDGQTAPFSAGPNLPLLVFGVAAAAMIVFTHRTNIARMRAGTEPRARKLWLFRGKRT